MSISAARIKEIQSLKLKKQRNALGLFVAEGEKVIHELLAAGMKLTALFSTENVSLDVDPVLVTQISPSTLSRISHFATPNKMLGLFQLPTTTFVPELALKELVMVLDRVNDPGNLGTLIRIADWFGIRHVVCSEGSADPYQPKVVQSSMGSIAHVQLYKAELSSLFAAYEKEKPNVYGALMEGQPLFSASLKQNGFIVFGNESHGISKELLPHLSEKLTIPAFGRAESLNVAAAAAIVCAEFRRN
jgi:TrmH family RNA methyltransferase